MGTAVAVGSAIAFKATALVGAGFCLCIGFHLGKKATNKLDGLLLRFDKEEIEVPFPYRTIVYKKELKK